MQDSLIYTNLLEDTEPDDDDRRRQGRRRRPKTARRQWPTTTDDDWRRPTTTDDDRRRRPTATTTNGEDDDDRCRRRRPTSATTQRRRRPTTDEDDDGDAADDDDEESVFNIKAYSTNLHCRQKCKISWSTWIGWTKWNRRWPARTAVGYRRCTDERLRLIRQMAGVSEVRSGSHTGCCKCRPHRWPCDRRHHRSSRSLRGFQWTPSSTLWVEQINNYIHEQGIDGMPACLWRSMHTVTSWYTPGKFIVFPT